MVAPLMSLRTKTLLTIGVACIALVSALLAVSSHIFMGEFRRAEVREAGEAAQHLSDHLGEISNFIDKTCWDWAAWDDTYRYIRDKNPDYEAGTLLPESLAGVDLDFILLVSQSGALVFGQGVDSRGTRFVPLPRGLWNTVRTSPRLGRHSSAGDRATGILMLPDGPAMVSSRPIVTSRQGGPVRGALVMGRFLNKREFTRVCNLTRIPGALYPLADPALPSDFVAARHGVQRTGQTFIRANSQHTVSAYTFLNDYAGTPVLILRADSVRTTYRQGVVASQYTVTVVLVVGLVLAVVMERLLERLVLARLLRLERAVHSISASGNAAGRVPVEGEDELGLLGDGINRMLVALERSQAEQRENEARLAHQAFHDPLTKLPNRAMFLDEIGRSMARAQRAGRLVAVLFLDLDNFKWVNDSLGHDVGDGLLVHVAERIRASLRASDFAARLGGDEFTVLVEDVTDESDAVAVAERLLEQFRKPVALGDREIHVSPSIGIAVGDPGGVTSGELLKNADVAMYHAKAGGRARYAVYQESLSVDALRRLELVHALRDAVERQDFHLNYQPKVILCDGRLYGVEALARWRHPQRGMVAPSEFIPLAEETGLIVPFGQWVLREACRQMRAWQDAYPAARGLCLSVNMSAREFARASLVDDVQGVLRDTGLSPACLILEITESLVVEDAVTTITVLQGLRDLGVRFAVDDFGTGYSSLSYLRRFPVDFVKIDRSFISSMEHSPEQAIIVSSTVDLAHALGMKVVAEGVETEQQADALRLIDCDLAQGNYFDVPLEAADVERRLLLEGPAYREERLNRIPATIGTAY